MPGGLQRTEPKISVKIPHNLKSCSCMSYGVLLPTGSCLSDSPIKLKKNKKTRKANSLLLYTVTLLDDDDEPSYIVTSTTMH